MSADLSCKWFFLKSDARSDWNHGRMVSALKLHLCKVPRSFEMATVQYALTWQLWRHCPVDRRGPEQEYLPYEALDPPAKVMWFCTRAQQWDFGFVHQEITEKMVAWKRVRDGLHNISQEKNHKPSSNCLTPPKTNMEPRTFMVCI